jgi:hypothetical protein
MISACGAAANSVDSLQLSGMPRIGVPAASRRVAREHDSIPDISLMVQAMRFI